MYPSRVQHLKTPNGFKRPQNEAAPLVAAYQRGHLITIEELIFNKANPEARQKLNRHFADARYWTEYVADNSQGFAGLRLHREWNGSVKVAAEVIFWDATGQYFAQTFDGELPVELLEGLIAETKERICTR